MTEKSLVGKGTRRLYLVDEEALVEYAGERKAKFVSKDAGRFEDMTDKAREMLGKDEVTRVVLLGENGTMCRRNTLPRLHGNGVVVMRCPREVDDEEDSGE